MEESLTVPSPDTRTDGTGEPVTAVPADRFQDVVIASTSGGDGSADGPLHLCPQGGLVVLDTTGDALHEPVTDGPAGAVQPLRVHAILELTEEVVTETLPGFTVSGPIPNGSNQSLSEPVPGVIDRPFGVSGEPAGRQLDLRPDVLGELLAVLPNALGDAVAELLTGTFTSGVDVPAGVGYTLLDSVPDVRAQTVRNYPDSYKCLPNDGQRTHRPSATASRADAEESSTDPGPCPPDAR